MPGDDWTCVGTARVGLNQVVDLRDNLSEVLEVGDAKLAVDALVYQGAARGGGLVELLQRELDVNVGRPERVQVFKHAL